MLALSLWRALYRVLLFIARPWIYLRLRLKSRSEPEYGRRIGERFGRVPACVPSSPVWFHTVSAGETIAAAPLIERLNVEFPQIPFLVTTMTPTGSAQTINLLGDRVAHCYAPYDFPDAVNTFFDSVNPRLLILMETELWPNMLRTANARNVPALLVNARLSQRSARGYARIGALTREMLQSLKFIACQYPAHAERFLALGAGTDRIGALGSVKFDVSLPEDHVARVRVLEERWQLAGRLVWIAGSTHPGEEETVLEAHRRIREHHPNALLILVPRHPHRADEVSGLVEAAGFELVRMSAANGGRSPAVVLGDTMGELLYLYGLSRIAFLGGSLVSVGGHNPIEAAICGQPLVMGPETFNFPDVVAAFSDARCLTLVLDAQSLSRTVVSCFDDPDRTELEGERARQVIRENTGATDRLIDLLSTQLRAVNHTAQ